MQIEEDVNVEESLMYLKKLGKERRDIFEHENCREELERQCEVSVKLNGRW